MRDDEIDAILREEPALVQPRGSFSMRVMRGVRSEQARATAMPIPWLRIISGVGLLAPVLTWTCLVVLGWLPVPCAHPALAISCVVIVAMVLILRLVLDSQDA